MDLHQLDNDISKCFIVRLVVNVVRSEDEGVVELRSQSSLMMLSYVFPSRWELWAYLTHVDSSLEASA